jgi:hypothetical protein
MGLMGQATWATDIYSNTYVIKLDKINKPGYSVDSGSTVPLLSSSQGSDNIIHVKLICNYFIFTPEA